MSPRHPGRVPADFGGPTWSAALGRAPLADLRAWRPSKRATGCEPPRQAPATACDSRRLSSCLPTSPGSARCTATRCWLLPSFVRRRDRMDRAVANGQSPRETRRAPGLLAPQPADVKSAWTFARSEVRPCRDPGRAMHNGVPAWPTAGGPSAWGDSPFPVGCAPGTSAGQGWAGCPLSRPEISAGGSECLSRRRWWRRGCGRAVCRPGHRR
jgi:hypothetical protein